MRVARQEAPVVRTSTGMWVIGGKNAAGEVLTSVEFLEATPLSERRRRKEERRTFRERTPLPLELGGLTATVINNNIYLTGTAVKTQVSTILHFDGESWNPAGKLLHARYSAKGTTYRMNNFLTKFKLFHFKFNPNWRKMYIWFRLAPPTKISLHPI